MKATIILPYGRRASLETGIYHQPTAITSLLAMTVALTERQLDNVVCLVSYKRQGDTLDLPMLLTKLKGVRTIVVTSAYEYDNVRASCRDHNVPLLPKAMIAHLPIVNEETH